MLAITKWTGCTGHNGIYKKLAVQWLNQALCFYQSLYMIDSKVLRNHHLRLAPKYDPSSMNNRIKHKQVMGQMNHQATDPKANASVFLLFPSHTNGTLGFATHNPTPPKTQRAIFYPNTDNDIEHLRLNLADRINFKN